MKLVNNLIHKFEALSASEDTLLIGGFLCLSICFSLILFCAYKINVKQQKDRKKRYRTVLWGDIIAKTIIPVPIISWIVCVIVKLFSNFNFNYINWLEYGFIPSWILWCATIWISRKIYKKIQGNKFKKPPTSFYK